MRKKVKVLAIILATVMIFIFTGCSKEVKNTNEKEAIEAVKTDVNIEIPKNPNHVPISKLEEEGGSIGLTDTNYNVTEWVNDKDKVKMLKKLNKQDKYVTKENRFVYENCLYDLSGLDGGNIKKVDLDNPQNIEDINVTWSTDTERYNQVHDWTFHDGYVYVTNLGYEKADSKYYVFVHRLNPANGKVDMDYYKAEIGYMAQHYIPDIIDSKLNITGAQTGVYVDMKTKEAGTYENTEDGVCSVEFLTKDYIIENRKWYHETTERLLRKIGTDEAFFDGTIKGNEDKIFEWNPEFVEIDGNTAYTIIRESTSESPFPFLHLVKLDLDKLYNNSSPTFNMNGKTYYGEIVKKNITVKDEDVVMWTGSKLRPDIISFKRDGNIQFNIPVRLNDTTIIRYVILDPKTDEVKIFDCIARGVDLIYENGAFVKDLLK